MAITYGFYNSMNGDRKYDAVQLSSIFDGVIRDGVFQSIGEYLATKPGTGMQVIVAPGKAWFDHTWTVNDADLPLDISQSDLTLSRYDAVVLETDATKSVRENSIKVIKGTPASTPQKPTLTNEGDIHQHPLAYILVPGGSTEIQAQNIDIMVGKTECPFVTSILESVSIEALLEKWEGEFKAWSAEKENDFQTWFDDLQSQMEGDVATNLQNQINKINQTTATEETKSLYGVPSDGTPDDVFQAINSIGDIKVSTRTDLGDHWLLCNGAVIDQNKYPLLSNRLPNSAAAPKSSPATNYNPPGSHVYSGLNVVDNYKVMFGFSDYTKYAYKPINSPSSGWTEKTFPAGLPYAVMKHIGGKYIAYSPRSATTFFHANSIGGPWTKVVVSIPSGYWSAGDSIHYSNGYFFIFLQDTLPNVSSTDSRGIAYATSVSGEWKFFKPTAFNARKRMDTIGYVNGKWVIFARDYDRSERAIKTVSLNSDITSLTGPSEDSNIVCTEVVSVNSKLYAAHSGVYVMEDPSSNFRKIGSSYGSAIAQGEGWVFGVASGRISAVELSTETVYDLKNVTGARVPCGFGNGYLVTTGDPNYFYARPSDVVVKYLPSISVSNAYAYIRGK